MRGVNWWRKLLKRQSLLNHLAHENQALILLNAKHLRNIRHQITTSVKELERLKELERRCQR